MNAPVVDVSIEDQVRSVRTGSTTATELVSRARTAIDAQEPVLQAWVQMSSTTAEDVATIDADRRDLPLRGISVGVKDLIDVAGMPTVRDRRSHPPRQLSRTRLRGTIAFARRRRPR